MKFVCEKCNTKYSIADEKVHRKVLKIRCKNCTNIITVQESVGKQASVAADIQHKAASRPLEKAFDGAFGGSPAPAMGPLEALPQLAPDDGLEPEPTRLSDAPEFLEELLAGGIASGGETSPDDEWYLAVDGNQYGPMAFTELCSRVKRGETGDEAFVWREDFEDWLELHEVPDLQPYVPKHPPPPPKGKSGMFNLPGSPDAPQLSPNQDSQSRPMIPKVDSSSGSGLFQNSPAPVLPAAASVPLPTAPGLPPVMATPQPPPVAAPVPAPAIAQVPGSVSVPLPTPSAPIVPVPGLAPLQPPAAGSAFPDAPIVAPVTPEVDLAPLAVATPLTGQPASGRTPTWMIIAGIGGGLAALCGVFLVGYSVLYDRPEPKTKDAPVAAAPGPGPGPAPAQPDAAVAAVVYPPMEIERSKTSERTVKRLRKSNNNTAPPTKAGPTLTAKQKRLMSLYSKSGPSEAAPRAPAAPSRKPKPSRRISVREIFALQRKNQGPLKACYERLLKRDDSMTRIKAIVTVTIGSSGIVKKLKIRAGNNPLLVNCMRRTIRRWAFPASGEQTIEFPIIFSGS